LLETLLAIFIVELLYFQLRTERRLAAIGERLAVVETLVTSIVRMSEEE